MTTTRLHLLSKPLSRYVFRNEPAVLLRSPAHRNTVARLQCRGFGDSSASSSSSPIDDDSTRATATATTTTSSPQLSSANEWRKQQLEKIENKFNKGKQQQQQQRPLVEASVTVESEEDLQPMWKEMEGRVTKRKLRTLEDTGGKSGRMNITKTDEDVWLEEGLYSSTEKDDEENERR